MSAQDDKVIDQLIRALVDNATALKEQSVDIRILQTNMGEFKVSQADLIKSVTCLLAVLENQEQTENNGYRRRSQNYRFFEKVLNSKVADWTMKMILALVLGGDVALRIFGFEVNYVDSSTRSSPAFGDHQTGPLESSPRK